jgi:hypothetical protein
MAVDLRQARRKKRAGEPLTPEEAAALQEYSRAQNARRVHIYWPSVEKLAEHHAMARRAGVNVFSDWVYSQFLEGLRTDLVDPSLVHELNARLAREREMSDREQSRSEEYRKELREVRTALARAEERLEKLALDAIHRAVADKANRPQAASERRRVK